MTSAERAARPSAWAEPGPRRPVRRSTRSTVTAGGAAQAPPRPVEIVSRAVQPLLWLLVFGQVLARTRAIPTGHLVPRLPGAGHPRPERAVQRDLLRDRGHLGARPRASSTSSWSARHRAARSSSARRSPAASAAWPRPSIVYIVSSLLGVHLRLDPLAILGVASSSSWAPRCSRRSRWSSPASSGSRERFMGIGQLLTMPLFFASSAIYPVSMMPDWLKVVALLNPLTYMVDALRSLMIVGAESARTASGRHGGAVASRAGRHRRPALSAPCGVAGCRAGAAPGGIGREATMRRPVGPSPRCS